MVGIAGIASLGKLGQLPKGITSLKMSPFIAKNISTIFKTEKPVIPAITSKKTVRVRHEFPKGTNISAMEEKYKPINLKIKPQGKKQELRGSFDAPLEHVTTKDNVHTLTQNPKIRNQYPVPAVSQKFAIENIDDPFFKQLGKEYANKTYKGQPFPRLTKPLLTRLANLNRKKVGNELGVDTPLREFNRGDADSSIMKIFKRTNPDIETLPFTKRFLTRGSLKRNKTLNDYLSELEPKTGMPRYETMTNQELALDPRFKGFYKGDQTGEAGLKVLADRIQEFRKKNDLELVYNKFGREIGKGGKHISLEPLKGSRMYEVKKLFNKRNYKQSSTRERRILDTAKRSEVVMNAVLDNLSPDQRKIALGMLEKGKPFMQALHTAAARSKDTPKRLYRPEAMSTWYRNIMHRESENAIKVLLKEKSTKGKNRSDFEIDFEIAGWEDDMRALGLQSEIDGKVYGAYYDQSKGMIKPLVQNLQKEYPLKMLNFRGQKFKPKGAKDGGLINDNLTDTIPPNRGPMSDGIPLLDPEESIQRQHFVGGGGVGAASKLFGVLSKAPRAVARVGDIKRPTFTKPSAAGEVAVSQAVEDKPAMFLSTVNAIEEMPDVNMGAQQWLGTIKNKPGVSATELDEFGLEALLNNIAKKDPKRKLSKTELLETYNKEMPKIDMDIAMAEPVSRGAKDLTNMLTKVRERSTHSPQMEGVNVTSNDARLFSALHQPPQDRIGFHLRGKILDIMKGTSKIEGDHTDVSLLNVRYGGTSVELNTGQHFPEMWQNAFPNIYHTTNKILKEGHFDVLKNLVPAEDITKLSKAKNISEEEAFNQLYQALNIFDRQVVTADVPIPFWTKKLLYRLGDMSEGRGFFFKSKKSPAHDGAQFIPGGSGYGELKFYFNFDTGAIRAGEKEYRAGHFSGEVFQGNAGNSPFGWGRFSERIDESGRKILLMEEIQSDLHQQVAQKGYQYAPRLDKGDVLAEMGDFAAQLDKKMQTLESTRLRKDNIMNLSRAERESPENVAELKNIEKAMKKLVGDVKKLKVKVEEQKRTTGTSGQVHPDAPFKKSENYAKVFLQGLMKMAADKGYDGIGLSTGRMKKAHGGIPKGGDKFYDEIGVKAMKRIAKKSGFKFNNTTIVDGNGYTWEKIPLIEMRDINTGQRIPGESTIPVYSKGGFVKQNMVRGNNNGY